MKPSAYLDALKAQLNINSDYELAKRLGIPNANMPGMRDGSRKVSNDLAFKIAITLELDPASVIADLEEQRAKNPERREFWRGFLQRAGRQTVALLCTLALIFSATFGSVQERLGGSLFAFRNRA